MTSRTPGRFSKRGRLDGALVAGDADGRALRARDRVGLEAEGSDRFDDAPNLFGGRRGIHDDEHRGAII